MKEFPSSRFLTITAFGAAMFLSSCAGAGVQNASVPRAPDALSAAAPTFGTTAAYAVLYPFTGGLDGGNAATQLVFDPSGDAFGTTVQGGGNGPCGTVFRLHQITPGHWHESVLYNFTCFSDGKNPHGGVVRDSQGNLYGTTVAGGLSGGCTDDGCGVVFEIPRGGGRELVLHTFQNKADGFGPGSPLAIDSAGNLYGATPDGGNFGHGTIFELVSSGGFFHFEVIHQFTDGNDGSTGSLGALFVSSDGSLYGVTELGGAHQAGIAYKMTHVSGSIWHLAPIYAFKGAPDAASPYGGLIEHGGKFYGTTYFGGAGGNGSVYELTPGAVSYAERVLYSFKGGTDGSNPTSTLRFGPDGALYGTTSMGGTTSCDCGTVFSLANTTFTETVLHRFGALHDGQNPYYGLTQVGPTLYSSTVAGGTSGNGTIFSITP